MAKTLLQLMAHAGIIAYEVAGLDEEVQKIELSRSGLEHLIFSNRRLESFVKQRREIRIAGRYEDLEIGLSLIAADKDLVPRQRAEGRSIGAFPAPAPEPGQSAQLCLEPVIVATADRLDSGRFFDKARDLGEVAGEAVVGPRTHGCPPAELRQLVHETVDRVLPVEGITAPALGKIAVLAKALHCAAQLLPRGLHARSPPENPSNTLRRIGERALEPALERFVGKRFGCILRGDFEERVNPCLDWSFVQKVAAEGVYCADSGEFQVLECQLQPVALLGSRRALAFSISFRRRSFISPAAFSVKVTATTPSSELPP